MTASFSAEQVAYLTSERRLGRLASLEAGGLPHLVPLGWSYNAELGTIDISGRNFAATRKFHNVEQNPNVAFLVDDVLPPWQPRAVMVQGRAEAIPADPGAEGGPTEAMLRITPVRIIAWGIESVRAPTPGERRR
jgi:pyridoxamine 5'-phosphate oxidase family protein